MHAATHKSRSIELLPYQDFPICRLLRNVPSGHETIPFHVSSKVHQCIGKKFPSIGPSLNMGNMLMFPIPLQFTLEGYSVEINRHIHKVRWRLLHPKLTKDTFGMMLLYYPKIYQRHNGPPYMLANSAIWRQRVQDILIQFLDNLSKWSKKQINYVLICVNPQSEQICRRPLKNHFTKNPKTLLTYFPLLLDLTW